MKESAKRHVNKSQVVADKKRENIKKLQMFKLF